MEIFGRTVWWPYKKYVVSYVCTVSVYISIRICKKENISISLYSFYSFYSLSSLLSQWYTTQKNNSITFSSYLSLHTYSCGFPHWPLSLSLSLSRTSHELSLSPSFSNKKKQKSKTQSLLLPYPLLSFQFPILIPISSLYISPSTNPCAMCTPPPPTPRRNHLYRFSPLLFAVLPAPLRGTTTLRDSVSLYWSSII